jgi:serine/threonine protein kinase
MFKQHIIFPKGIIKTHFGIEFNPENPTSNILTLNKVDYFPNYFNLENKGNKGSNIILKLFAAQTWDEEEGYPDIPDLIMKICKTPLQRYEKPRSKRFNDEIIALRDCNKVDPLNTIKVYHYGSVKIYDKEGYYSTYRFYTMDYASDDLHSFLIRNNPSILDRINLFLEICDSLQLLWKANYYHRDIKPDNILFFGGKWKLGDLGLVEHRYKSFEVDEVGEWIGPRGWQSPEAINKFVTEGTPWKYRFDTKIDHQSDLYQLGKLLWFITQGNCPEGGIKRSDFLMKDDRLYQVVKTLLNSNKKRRTKDIGELITEVKTIFNIYYRTNPFFSLH